MRKYLIETTMNEEGDDGYLPSKKTSNDGPKKEAVCDSHKHPWENSHQHHL